MSVISESENAFSSHQQELLYFLNVVCQDSSRAYGALAKGCLRTPETTPEFHE